MNQTPILYKMDSSPKIVSLHPGLIPTLEALPTHWWSGQAYWSLAWRMPAGAFVWFLSAAPKVAMTMDSKDAIHFTTILEKKWSLDLFYSFVCLQGSAKSWSAFLWICNLNYKSRKYSKAHLQGRMIDSIFYNVDIL